MFSPTRLRTWATAIHRCSYLHYHYAFLTPQAYGINDLLCENRRIHHKLYTFFKYFLIVAARFTLVYHKKFDSFSGEKGSNLSVFTALRKVKNHKQRHCGQLTLRTDVTGETEEDPTYLSVASVPSGWKSWTVAIMQLCVTATHEKSISTAGFG